MVEEWRSIPDRPGYEVSNLGNFRCWNPQNRNSAPPAVPRPVKSHPGTGLYRRVLLGYRTKTLMVHTVVAQVFHGPRPSPKHQASHINGDAWDNRAANLTWELCSQNQARKRRHGTNAKKLTESVVTAIRKAYRAGGVTQREVGETFDVTQATISKIVRNDLWKEHQ